MVDEIEDASFPGFEHLCTMLSILFLIKAIERVRYKSQGCTLF